MVYLLLLIGSLCGIRAGGFMTEKAAYPSYPLPSAFLRSRCSLGVLKRKRPRPRLRTQDRIFRILLRRLWPAWKSVLVIVKPETVVAWHRTGFRLFWRLRSRPKSLGRPKTDAEIRAVIQKMLEENPTRGAPRICGELLKLGLYVSERTVSRCLRRLSPRDKARQLWSACIIGTNGSKLPVKDCFLMRIILI